MRANEGLKKEGQAGYLLEGPVKMCHQANRPCAINRVSAGGLLGEGRVEEQRLFLSGDTREAGRLTDRQTERENRKEEQKAREARKVREKQVSELCLATLLRGAHVEYLTVERRLVTGDDVTAGCRYEN